MKRLSLVVILLALFAGACSSDDSPEVGAAGSVSAGDTGGVDLTADSNHGIRIALHNWSSQLVGAEVIGSLLEGAGYEIEYVEIDSRDVYQSMCDGEIEIVHEIWEAPFGLSFEDQVGAGCVLDWATHSANTRQGWWYPDYVEEQCPGLPDWEALNDCSAIFANTETGLLGRYLTGPLDWLTGDVERVEALEMDFAVRNAESGIALWDELQAAVETRTPIVIFNWTPNYVEAIHTGSFIEFPDFEEDCFTDPTWGTNPDLTHDCGNPSDGYLKIGVNGHFPEQWPVAAALLGRIDLTNGMLSTMAALVDVAGMSPSEAAEAWIEANPAVIAQWTTG